MFFLFSIVDSWYEVVYAWIGILVHIRQSLHALFDQKHIQLVY